MGVFQKASKTQAKLRLALVGTSGSGKTYSALRIAKGLGGKVAVIDSEQGSASKYADARLGFEFDVLNLSSFGPERYVEAIKAAEAEGYAVLIIDSLSHAWTGKDGALEQVDNAAQRAKGNKFAGWRDVTPKHNALIDAIIRSKCHVIATMRSKTEYVLEDDGHGKKVPRKIGMAPVQRDGMEYEFDVVGDTDDAKLIITKTRYPPLKGRVINEPGEDLGRELGAWLSDGAPAPAPVTTQAQPHANGKESPWDRLNRVLAERGIAFDLAKPILKESMGNRTKPSQVNDADVEKVLAAFPEPPPKDADGDLFGAAMGAA